MKYRIGNASAASITCRLIILWISDTKLVGMINKILPFSKLNVMEDIEKQLMGLKPPDPASNVGNGISLLTAKSAILSLYIQQILIDILSNFNSNSSESEETIRKKIIELGVYYEKGVLSLEQKLKYPIEKALKAAQLKEQDSASDNANSLQFRPNLDEIDSDSDNSLKSNKSEKASNRNHIYRPPKSISTLALSLKENERRHRTNYALESYLNDMNDQPEANISIGTNIIRYGKKMANVSEKEKREERERREYEESNYVRLPSLTKQQKRKLQRNKSEDVGFGGEDWRMLNDYNDLAQKANKSKFKRIKESKFTNSDSLPQQFEKHRARFNRKLNKKR